MTKPRKAVPAALLPLTCAAAPISSAGLAQANLGRMTTRPAMHQSPGPLLAVARVVHEFGLSRRESEVLGAASEGRCTKEIAAELGVSRKTVEYFWTRIYAKLRCASHVEVMAVLLRRASVWEPSDDLRSARPAVGQGIA